MSNGDDSPLLRKSHVVRLYKDDDTSSEVWADIERIDRFVFETGTGFFYRKWFFDYDWDSFEPDTTDTDKYKEIHDPDNPDSKDATLKIPIRTDIDMESGSGYTWQKTTYSYDESSDNTIRKVHVRQVNHYDIPNSSLDGKGQPPSDPQDYLKIINANLGTKDESQKVKTEVVDGFETTTGKGFTWRKWIWSLAADQDPLLTFGMDGQDATPVTAGDCDPPWRLDPLQNIINISWGGGLAVEFFDGAGPPIPPPKPSS